MGQLVRTLIVSTRAASPFLPECSLHQAPVSRYAIAERGLNPITRDHKSDRRQNQHAQNTHRGWNPLDVFACSMLAFGADARASADC